jgi:uncharacterized protein (TIGR04255 family)
MVSFVSPPVAEVSVGVVFSPRPDLLIAYIGDFWSLIRDRYSRSEHAQLVLGEGEAPVQDQFGNWLPRVWFLSEDNCMVVQVQQDRLYVNWRATDKDAPYPRFLTVKNEFDRVWSLFVGRVAELTGTPPVPVRVEVSYTNFILGGEVVKSTADLSKVLKDFRWSEDHKYLSPPSGIAMNMTFPLHSGAGNLRVRTATAERAKDRARGLRLELQVVAAPNAGQSIDELIEEGHQTIIRAFEDLTTAEMQDNHWIRG